MIFAKLAKLFNMQKKDVSILSLRLANFDEMVEMEIVQQMGRSGTRFTSTDSIRQSMCDICVCISWPEKSQHASSHIDRFVSRCAISVFCISWPEKSQVHNMHHRTSTDSPIDVRYLFCISWPEKSQHASSHIDRFDSPVDVRYLFLYPCIITHRLANRQSMCDIDFVTLGQKKSQHASSHID